MSKNGSMTGAYALNALSPEERESLEREMRASFTLRDEVTGLQDTAVLLNDLIPEVQPPDHLRIRVMAAIERTPQLSAEEMREPVTQRAPAALRRLLGGLKLPAGLTAPRAIFTGVGATAALALALVVTPTTINALAPTAPVAVQAASDENSKSFALKNGTSATVIWSNKLDAGYVYTSTKNLPSGKTYQLWLTRDDATKSAGLAQNNKWTKLPTLQDGDVIRMTVEPKGGSEAPSSKPVLTVAT